MSAKNRSMPECTVIPVLHYPNVRESTEWLCSTFGFEARLRIGSHRCQLSVPPGVESIVIARSTDDCSQRAMREHSVMIRVNDVDAHYARVTQSQAEVVSAPATMPYGERQYTVKDHVGHVWTFSQTVADVDPSDWGGTLETEG